MTLTPAAVLAPLSLATVVGLMVYSLVPPPRSVRSRVRPYLNPSLTGTRAKASGGPISTVFGPIANQLAAWLGRLLERSGDQVTIDRLRQAGWYRDVPESEMISAYRMSQLRSISVALLLGLALGQILSLSPVFRVLLGGLAVLVGATRHRSGIQKAIDARRELMRIEIYTVNQLLAMRVRAGGGVVNAVTSTVHRGQGEVVTELADALRLHRAGWTAGDAFRRIAELTPEQFCGRTYRLLATADERGADLAGGLLDLAEDVRETRRESIKRSATKRRAAMLVPTIAILAPVLILFVAAPLPYLITGWR